MSDRKTQCNTDPMTAASSMTAAVMRIADN